MSAVREARAGGEKSDGGGGRAELRAAVRELARLQRTLVARLSSAELLADTVSCEIARLERILEGGAAAGGVDARAGARASKAAGRENLRRLAEGGVAYVEIRPRADGLSDVRVDGGKQFTLPPTLADLLHVLATSGGTSEDDLVGWKTTDEVAILLGKLSGRRFTRHGVAQNVHRLRRELLERGGANPFLIQTNRRRGLRFALRRRTEPVLSSEQ